ncbi:MAG: hypothetical protein LBU43_10680 [Candidatus Accumulibacter sp.]|jgi:hypothetical protein|nr:hypothetical protein [Accumulibacter sp.]
MDRNLTMTYTMNLLTKNSAWRGFACFFLLFAILVISAKPAKTPSIQADGFEYFMMTHALIERLSPSVKCSEAQAIAEDARNTSISSQLKEELPRLCYLNDHPEPGFKIPWFVGVDEEIYSWHFWIYSLTVVPFMLITMTMGLGDTTAFLLANLAFSGLALAAIFLLYPASLLRRMIIAFFFLCVGTVYYTPFAHPEVFTASLLLIGILFLRKNHIKIAAIFIAVAGQQNPPLLLLLPIVFLMDFFQLKTGHFDGWKKFILSWIGLSLVAAMAIRFSLYQFGVLNPISAVGWADIHLISLDRVLALYFDPNTGGFSVVPMLLIGIIAVPFCLYRITPECKTNVKWALLFALMSVIVTTASTSTINLNSGSHIIHRYSYGILIPVIMIFGEMMQSLFLRRNIVLAIMAAGQLLFTAHLDDSRRFYLYFTHTELILLDHFPELYNPIPEIFVERGYRRDEPLLPDVYFWIYHGEVRKVLFQGDDMINKLPLPDLSTLESHRISRKQAGQNWQYWNIREGCKTNLADGFVGSKQLELTAVDK